MPPLRDCMGGVEFMLYFFVGLTERDGSFFVGQKRKSRIVYLKIARNRDIISMILSMESTIERINNRE